MISCFGVYVALLGMKATTEHFGHIAKKFLVILGLLGVSWTSYTFYCHFIFNLALEKELMDDTMDGGVGNGDDYQKVAVKVSIMEMTLPFFVWVMFYICVLQFYTMIREAELEAAERARSLMPIVSASSGDDNDINDDGSGNNSNGNGGNGGNRRNQGNGFVNHESYDLELQREDGVLT